LNLALLCSACHLAHHRGALTISGTADRLEVCRPEHAATRADAQTSVAHPGAHVGAAYARSSDASASAHVGAIDVATSVDNVAEPRMDERAGSRLDAAILRTQAKAALTTLGWKPAIAHAAVAAAAAAQGTEVTLERLIFESLRRCPVPRAAPAPDPAAP
jgi:hypothetical protein